MTTELNNFVGYINNSDKSFSEADLRASLPSIYDFLIQTGILTPCSPTRLAKCIDCDNEHYENVVEIEGKYFIKCGYSDYGSLREVQKDELTCYSLSLSVFAKWLSERLNLTEHLEQIDDEVWYLGLTVGGKPDLKVYFISSNDFDIVTSKYNPNSMVYLWLGEIPYNKSVGKNLISIKDLLLLNGTSVEIDKSPFNALTELLTTKVEEVILRTDSAIRKETTRHYLLLGRNASLQNFNHKESISPKSYELLKFASKPKVLKTGFTLEDAVNEDIAENKRTISKYIKELNDKCTNKDIPEILIKADKTHWKLDSPRMVNENKKDF